MSRVAIRTLQLALWVHLAVVLFPLSPYPYLPGEGLDPSWAWALNRCWADGVVFGRDVVFNHGPLGFLVVPLAMGSNVQLSLAVKVALWLGLVALLADRVRRHDGPRSLPDLVAAAALLSTGKPYLLDHVAVLVAYLALAVSMEARRWAPLVAGAAAIAVGLFLVKFSSFVAAVGMLAVVPWVHPAMRGRRGEWAVGGGAGLAAACALAYLAYHPSPAGLAGYVRGIAEVVSAYSVALSRYEGPRTDYALAAMALASIAAWMAWAAWSDRRTLRVSVLAAPVAFVAAKHGFVTHDLHVMIFFLWAASILGVTMLSVGPRRSPRGGALLALPVLAAYALAYGQHMAPVFGWDALASWARGDLARRELAVGLGLVGPDEAGPALVPVDVDLADRRLAGPVRAAIGDRPVAVLPYELSYVPANGLRWWPPYVLQTYGAFTAYLDRRTAEGLADPAAGPEKILLEWTPVDDRNVAMDGVAIWMGLLRGWRVEAEARGGEMLLLGRRPAPRFGAPEVLERTRHRREDWIAVPFPGQPVVARVRLDLSAVGTARRWAFKIPPVVMEVRRDDGREARFRVMPDPLRNGFLASSIPLDLGEARALLEGEALPRVVAFRFGGNGAPYLLPEVPVEWAVIQGADPAL